MQLLERRGNTCPYQALMIWWPCFPKWMNPSDHHRIYWPQYDMTTESMLDLCHPLIHILNLAILSGPTGRARMCCGSKPTGEQRRATRRAGRLLARWQALLPRRRPAIPSRARRMCESRACHLTYTRSGGCRRAPNSFLHKKTRVNVSPSCGQLPGTTLASALKSRSSPGVRWDLIVSRYDK